MTAVELDWRSRAECRDVDAEIFFPVGKDGPVHDAQVAAAKTVCARCPVREACLTEALIRIPFGIAGGLTAEERRGQHRRRAGVEPAAVLGGGLRRGASHAQVAAAGRVLLAAGRPVGEVARRCGVTERTVTRWAARAGAEAVTGAVRGVA